MLALDVAAQPDGARRAPDPGRQSGREGALARPRKSADRQEARGLGLEKGQREIEIAPRALFGAPLRLAAQVRQVGRLDLGADRGSEAQEKGQGGEAGKWASSPSAR